LRYFEALTGIRNTDDYSVWKALKINLSIKSASNPLYWSSFVLLASPRRYMPRNLARVWWRYLQPLRARMVQILEPVRRLLAPVRRFAGRVKRKLLREWTGRMSSVMPPGGKGNEKR